MKKQLDSAFRKVFVLSSILSLSLLCSSAYSQDQKVTAGGFEGAVVAGFVDNGAFLNFVGPNIAYKTGRSKVMLGMLPSLRYKEDTSTGPTNSSVYPALGVGVAYMYRRLVVQVPLYYNAKNAAKDGEWVVGAGVGVKLSK